nr:MAG TPA: hypothetical protein [Caudoviricetes sp.]
MAPIRNGKPGTIRPALSILPAERPHAPPIFFSFVPLPTTKPARYAHTLPVIHTDKAHFVRQFNRTKYPYKGCYLLSVHMLGI